MKISKHPILTGALILTVTGLSSRVIGFFYRIFLSRTIGAGGLGIYQLVFPIFALCLSACTGGIQSGISKLVAEGSKKNKSDSSVLISGILLSQVPAAICACALHFFSEPISTYILGEKACEPLLFIVACSLPLACLHSCFNGFYYGKNDTKIPAISQLLEQCARVFSVYLFYLVATNEDRSLTPDLAMWGSFCGEAASCLFCLSSYKWQTFKFSLPLTKELFFFSAPLTGNRLVLNLFASAEAILLPRALVGYGFSSTNALEVFGIFSGMAFPVILLPTVFTGSLSVLLLPAIAKSNADADRKQLNASITKTVELCLILGLLCTLGFLLFGKMIGELLFQNELCGSLIRSLGFLCPFLFFTGTLSSVLHGLNHTMYTFIWNVVSCGIRILALAVLVPVFGLHVYLWSLLLSQILMTCAYIVKIKKCAQ